MTVDESSYCETCEQILYYISLVGISFSLFGLLITIGYDLLVSFFESNSDELHREKQNPNSFLSQHAIMFKQFLNIITTWCFSLVGMNIFYIVMASISNSANSYDELMSSKKSICIFTGVMLHYFLLSSFFFSLSISILQYLILYNIKLYGYIYLKAFLFSFGKFFHYNTLSYIFFYKYSSFFYRFTDYIFSDCNFY